jgi:hypothetical protein
VVLTSTANAYTVIGKGRPMSHESVNRRFRLGDSDFRYEMSEMHYGGPRLDNRSYRDAVCVCASNACDGQGIIR